MLTLNESGSDGQGIKSVASLLQSDHHIKYAALSLVRPTDGIPLGCCTDPSPESRWRVSQWQCSRAGWQWTTLWQPTRFPERFLSTPSGLRPLWRLRIGLRSLVLPLLGRGA